MKKFLLILCLTVSLTAYSKVLIVEGNYRGFDGQVLKKIWKVEIQKNKINFYLDGTLKASMYLNNGKISKLEEYKFFAGRKKLFVVTDPEKIKLELKSQFYPFSFVNEYLNGKTTKSKKNTFKILEVREK